MSGTAPQGPSTGLANTYLISPWNDARRAYEEEFDSGGLAGVEGELSPRAHTHTHTHTHTEQPAPARRLLWRNARKIVNACVGERERYTSRVWASTGRTCISYA